VQNPRKRAEQMSCQGGPLILGQQHRLRFNGFKCDYTRSLVYSA
jgi:hypothetical protein